MPEKCPVAPRLSVIVPVYQVAPYLGKCVASILGQTFSDFEVLLVDDGSTDGSGAICDALAEQDARVRVIHKANGGVSSARNAGLDAARGRYIGFVDADDWIEPAFYEKLVRNMEAHPEADVCIGGISDVRADGSVHLHFQKKLERQMLAPESAMKLVGERNRLSCYTVDNIYRRELLHGIRFVEQIHFGEDLIFIMEVYRKSRAMFYDPSPMYYYLQRGDSKVHRTFSLENSQFLAIKYIFEHIDGIGAEARRLLQWRFFRDGLRAAISLYFEQRDQADERLLVICDSFKFCADLDFEEFSQEEQHLFRGFVAGREGFFASLAALCDDFYRQAAALRKSAERLYLYGNGRLAGYLKRAFADLHLPYDGIVVSDGQAQRTAEQEREAVPLSKLGGPLEDAVFLLGLGPASAKAVTEQLAQRGCTRCYWPRLFHYLMWR